jgi:hypothetical protein
MSFEKLLETGWRDHGDHPQQVVQRFSELLDNAAEPAQGIVLGQLIVHVMGEHLGKWQEGLEWMDRLAAKFSTTTLDFDQALSRYRNTFLIALGNFSQLKGLSISDQIRSLAMAATALMAKGQQEWGKKAYLEAKERANEVLGDKDPAHRALAVMGNNISATLEEKPNRSADETDWMIEAAHLGRTHWKLAGSWVQVFWAEYRLAKSYLAAQSSAKARAHFDECSRLFEVEGVGLAADAQKEFRQALQELQGIFITA